MLILILCFVAGSLLAYISKSNLMPVTVNLGSYVFTNVPLFYVITASLVSGLILSVIIHFFRDVTVALDIRARKKEMKEKKSEVLELTKRVHKLELENEKLKHGTHNEPQDRNAL